MFTKARLKLTFWYLLIIMTISISFSGFIYNQIGFEFQRRFNNIERRLQLNQKGLGSPYGQELLFLEDLQAAKKGVLFLLVYTNGVIFVLSGIAGSFLARKTLQPIEDVLEEQKRFIADASHELKTPLTALQTSIEVALRDKKLTLKDAKKVLRESIEDTDNLNSLANDLLSLTRYQQNGDSLTREVFDIKKVINSSLKKIKPLATKKKIRINSKLEKVTINANKDSIEKLVTILLDNAVKYTSKNGEVNVTATVSRKCALIKVRDTGMGISKKDSPHIFDRFYRIDQSRSKDIVDGFGLGLSIAKKIVDLQGGSISVKSTPGKGSTFKVRLPLEHS